MIKMKNHSLIIKQYGCLYHHFHVPCFLSVLVDRVFASGPGDLSSIPSHVVQKTSKMVLDTSLLNTYKYKVRIKGKVEQSREGSSVLPYTSV